MHRSQSKNTREKCSGDSTITLTNLKDRPSFEFSIEEYSFLDEPDEADDEVAQNCKINIWRKDFFLFLGNNLDDPPKKTEINSK